MKTVELKPQVYNLPGKQQVNSRQVKIRFRKPSVQDGPGIWSLVKESGVLDLNSAYSYLMMCKFYSDTCIVAEHDNKIAGFVTAFNPPSKPDTIFVWQVGVAKSFRGKGLATILLKELLQRKSGQNVRFLEATVSPSNVPSQSLFRGLARDLNTQCEVTECFSEKLFPGDGHEAEHTFRIGPIKQ